MTDVKWHYEIDENPSYWGSYYRVRLFSTGVSGVPCQEGEGEASSLRGARRTAKRLHFEATRPKVFERGEL